jgi:hypothetical protein
MATTTTNFGWDIPQSTDLVKDGATAIAALGQDIDTALVDLKGGTTGQVLSKASNTDLDYSWVAVDPLLILDAKGDLISATAADTPARVAVGTNGQVLTADSTASTGLKWATPAAGGMTLLSTTTLSGASTVISISATGYNNLQIVVSGITINTNNDYPRMDFNSTSGTVYMTGTQSGSATTATELYFNGANELKKDGGLNTWIVDIANVNSGTYYKPLTSTSYGRTYLDANQARHEGGAFLSATAITGVRIQTLSGNTFSGGQVLIYGVK